MHHELDKLFGAIDQAFEAVRKDHREEITCNKGCADCCHAVFDVSLVEAVNLQTYLQQLEPTVQGEIAVAAQEARQAWEQIMESGLDPAVARIRCPLLDGQGACRCYEARPVNCRTYGIPTVIDGKGHVCGLSGFAPGKSYPTVNLASLQRRLYDLSVQLAGEEMGARRWPIATVILDLPIFAAFVAAAAAVGEK
ncbi:MAG: YkgJ family cysteine cluster protein [Desulfurivibrionaceae bacterium]